MTAGLEQEGLYRVNGNARMIEKLKVSFDKGWYSMCVTTNLLPYIYPIPLATVGDADFGDVDIAAIGGLLKLFLVSVLWYSVVCVF